MRKKSLFPDDNAIRVMAETKQAEARCTPTRTSEAQTPKRGEQLQNPFGSQELAFG
jgi:hypothetical protein